MASKKVFIGVLTLFLCNALHAGDGDTTKINFFTKYDLQQWKGTWNHKKFDYLDPSKNYKKAILVLELGCASYGCCVWDYNFHALIGKPLVGYDTLRFGKLDTVTWNSKITVLDSLWITRKSSNVEVSRLITPYGTYMRAGSNGFNNNWTHPYIFDITDYLPLLKDSFGLVIQSGGYDGKKGFNLTADLLLIEGVPTNRPKQVIKAYGRSFTFQSEAQIDTLVKPFKFKLSTNEKQAKFRTIVTGHGQQGEFSPIEYYVKLNGNEIFSKKLWREDCDKTHVQPQGGTWIFSRCNWCPGEKIIDFDIDLTPYLKWNDSNEIWISFRNMETSSTNIQANYSVSGNIITFENKPDFDMSISEVIAPSRDKTYFLLNPLCQGPIVKIRNEGVKKVTEAYIDYWIDGNAKTTYIWKGNLMPEQSEIVQLPAFPWLNIDYSAPIFYAALQRTAQNLETWNDQIQTPFDITPIFATNLLKFEIKTTNDTKDNILKIYDELNNEILSKVYKGDNKTYSDTITLTDGCYRMELIDFDDRLGCGDGLNFWWSTQQMSKSSGNFTIRNGTNNAVLKTFNADFGGKLNFQFTLNNKKIGEYQPLSDYNYKQYKFPDTTKGNITNTKSKLSWYLSPNPSSDGQLKIVLNQTFKSTLAINIFGIDGRLILDRRYNQNMEEINLSLEHFTKGVYIIKIKSEEFEEEKRWIYK